MDPLLLGTASAFGLAASAGLNTTLPLLIVGVLSRFGLLVLASPYDALASDMALGGLAALALLEIVTDKIPGVDTIIQTVQWPVAAAAGAILFASQASIISWVAPGLSILVGLLTAGAIHGVRTAARPASTTATLGTFDPVVSLVEDAYAVILTLTSVLLPIFAIVLLGLLVIGLILVAIWALRRGVRIKCWLR